MSLQEYNNLHIDSVESLKGLPQDVLVIPKNMFVPSPVTQNSHGSSNHGGTVKPFQQSKTNIKGGVGSMKSIKKSNSNGSRSNSPTHKYGKNKSSSPSSDSTSHKKFKYSTNPTIMANQIMNMTQESVMSRKG